MVELADLFRLHGPEYRARFGDRMPTSHLVAMQDSAQCRTEALGGQVSQCADGQALAYSYHSCKNRHCPKCQNDEATRWLAKQRERLLPVPYFLVTLTLPEARRP
jgi:Transposase zinc-binding domain